MEGRGRGGRGGVVWVPGLRFACPGRRGRGFRPAPAALQQCLFVPLALKSPQKSVFYGYSISRCALLNGPSGPFPKTSPVEFGTRV